MIRRDTRIKKKPYDRPAQQEARSPGGLFSKIKGIFKSSAPSSTSGNTVPSSDTTHNYDRSVLIANSTRRNDSLMDRTGDSHYHMAISHTNISNISNVSHNFSTSRNPNETLADFFSRKGDEPLSDIEVEGVLSLINKATEQNQQLLQSSPLRNISQSNNTTLGNPDSNSTFNINNSTTILRPSNLKTPVSIQTPTYKPRVNAITRNTKPQHQTIKKRIVTYSALPSPYRTRISSPLSNFKGLQQLETKSNDTMEKKNSLVYTSQGIDLTHLDDDEDDDGDVSMIEPKKEESTKPLSKTATRVLNILNGDTDLVNEKKPVVEKEQEKLKEPIKSDSKVTTNINGFTFSKSNSPANPAGSVSQVQTPTNVTKPVSVFQQTTTIKAPTPAFSINSMLNGKEDVKESKNNDIEIIDLDDESDEDDEVYNEEEEEEEEEDDEEEEEEQDEEEEEQEEEEEEEEEVEEVKQDQASEGNLHKSAPAISILPSVSSSNGLNIKPSTNGTAIASISNSNSTPLTTTKEVIEEFTFPDVEMADPELLKKLDENLEEYYRSVFIF